MRANGDCCKKCFFADQAKEIFKNMEKNLDQLSLVRVKQEIEKTRKHYASIGIPTIEEGLTCRKFPIGMHPNGGQATTPEWGWCGFFSPRIEL